MSVVHSFVPAYLPMASRNGQNWDGSSTSWYYQNNGASGESAYQSQNYGTMWTPTEQRWNTSGYVQYWPYTPQNVPSFNGSSQPRVQAPMVQQLQPVQPVQPVFQVTQPIMPVPLSYAPVYVAPPPAPHPAHFYTFNDAQRYNSGNQAVCQPQQQGLFPSNSQANQQVTQPIEPMLEYELVKMSDFLARMAYGIMSNRAPLWSTAQQDSFQKFVYMTLSSTRLSKSTVILALVYLSKRWALDDLPVENDVHGFYVLFVVSLVLANKVHDDNTFTNASWCQATGISSAEITHSEMQWLSKVSWSLQPPNFESHGWNKWHECWTVFCGQMDRQQPEQLPTPSVSPQAPSKATSSTVFTDSSWAINVPVAAF